MSPKAALAQLEKDARSTDTKAKADSVSLATGNSFGFCRANLMMRFLNTKDAPPKNCEFRNLKDLEAKVDSFISDKINPSANRPDYMLKDPWNLALMSTTRSRNLATRLVYPGTEKYLGNKYFRNAKFIAVNKAHVARMLSYWDVNRPDGITQLSESAQKKAACFLLGLPSECSRSLDEIQRVMTPSDLMGAAFINLQDWQRFYADETLDRGLFLLAKQMESMIESNESPPTNVFEMLANSFVKIGLSAARSQDASWLVLGLIGSGGANTIDRVQTLEEGDRANEISSKGLALGFIASAMTYFDYLNLSRGRAMFSYPANIKTSCDTAKPYHFWTSAYLARHLVKVSGIPRKTALKTTFLTEQAYQIKRSLFIASGRNGVSGVFTRANFDPVHQIIRADLAYAAAGAYYGAYSETSTGLKILDVNQAIVELLRDSQIVEPLKKVTEVGTLEGYRRFEKIFSPNSALKPLPDPNGN